MKASMEDRLASLETRVMALEARGAAPATTPVDMPDVDIDSERGNPVIRKDPPKWRGESCVGRPYSQCSPEYLRSLAGFLKWKAGKNAAEGKDQYAKYDMLDCARALKWAERIERSPQPSAPVVDAELVDDELPF